MQDRARQRGYNFSSVSCLWHKLPASWYIQSVHHNLHTCRQWQP